MHREHTDKIESLKSQGWFPVYELLDIVAQQTGRAMTMGELRGLRAHGLHGPRKFGLGRGKGTLPAYPYFFSSVLRRVAELREQGIKRADAVAQAWEKTAADNREFLNGLIADILTLKDFSKTVQTLDEMKRNATQLFNEDMISNRDQIYEIAKSIESLSQIPKPPLKYDYPALWFSTHRISGEMVDREIRQIQETVAMLAGLFAHYGARDKGAAEQLVQIMEKPVTQEVLQDLVEISQRI